MLGFIIKGLLRDRHRSLLPIITVGAGVMMITSLYGYMAGMLDNMLSAGSKIEHGHLKVMTQEYAQIAHQVPNDLAVFPLDQVLKKLNTVEGISWSSRIKFGGLLDVPDKKREKHSQGPVVGIGLDLLSSSSAEIQRLDLKKRVVEGRLPSAQGEIILSKKLGQGLSVKPGDTATLMGVSSDMAAHSFIIAGLAHFGVPVLDRNLILVDIQDVQDMLGMENSAGEILGFFDQGYYLKEKALSFKQQILSVVGDRSLIVFSVEETKDLGAYLQIVDASIAVIVGIMLLLMIVVVWNSSLMSGLRRYGEMGVRLALGESKSKLFRSLLYESLVIGSLGSFFGALLGTAFCWYLQVFGFDISEMVQSSVLLMEPVLRARTSWAGFFIGMPAGISACVIGTAMSGMGIYKRSTASLFNELDV